ncbi:MAG: hypothetical protein FWE14_11170 [Lachnospiraceae bacterium]|nr:hypothetical protein [Lachnospiraceae bacterium]
MEIEREKSLFSKYIDLVLITFAVSIFVLTTVAWLMDESLQEYGGAMSLAGVGVSYVTMLQFLAFSFVSAGIVFVFTYCFEKMPVVWRFILQLILISGVIILCIIVFKWFPLEMWEAWVSFIITYGITSSLSTVLIVIKNRMEDKIYQKKLLEYKENYNKKEPPGGQKERGYQDDSNE